MILVRMLICQMRHRIKGAAILRREGIAFFIDSSTSPKLYLAEITVGQKII